MFGEGAGGAVRTVLSTPRLDFRLLQPEIWLSHLRPIGRTLPAGTRWLPGNPGPPGGPGGGASPPSFPVPAGPPGPGPGLLPPAGAPRRGSPGWAPVVAWRVFGLSRLNGSRGMPYSRHSCSCSSGGRALVTSCRRPARAASVTLAPYCSASFRTAGQLRQELWSVTAITSRPLMAAMPTILPGVMSSSPQGERQE